MTSTPDRQRLLKLVEQAENHGARLGPVCKLLGLHPRTLKRWRAKAADGRPLAQRPVPANKLSEAERERIVQTCNLPRYAHLPPSQIVPMLLDEGIYLASESSFYRILREVNQIRHRGKAHPPRKPARPKSHCATAPNQVWSWDITYLLTTVRGQFYRLYLVMDIYSRKIVVWEVHERESAELASALITQACLREGIRRNQLVLHADNGGPMKGATMLATLQKLGVMPSFSRPAVSDDNPYSEALFRTLKYVPSYPAQPFASLQAARQWVQAFVQWYNETHRHSAIGFVTPMQRHNGEDRAILEARKAIYKQARQAHPERWSGATRNWKWVEEVWLNPDAEQRAKIGAGIRETTA
jgi:transposase InsO family protein